MHWPWYLVATRDLGLILVKYHTFDLVEFRSVFGLDWVADENNVYEVEIRYF